ncbi:helix-turn-helix domain-containing protein [Mobilicoccus pelagius]|uniref:Putative ArsR family transcriptional regulator n=1 Tax=Mobilicoccus pelagius NBRC 104925 TaxID=1089455 RepID=H5UR19_9MICO|nr:helix-turn-helix domain-containing protein [Mobilicoccus pelagius]GAB48177.1 putative ArsR family transcriptional regulator [Mobilicoccus pelagius NBRC 104925]
MSNSLEVLLHPVRWRIVQRLTRSPATPAQVQASLSGVATATLYRQLQTLLDAGLVAVVDEAKVRGAVERTYALAGVLAGPDPTPEGRRDQALLLLGLLQADVLSYLDGVGAEGVMGDLSLTRTALHATADEMAELRQGLTELLTPLLEPHDGARGFSLGLVVAPVPGGGAGE